VSEAGFKDAEQFSLDGWLGECGIGRVDLAGIGGTE
jgi:hypothetical protein